MDVEIIDGNLLDFPNDINVIAHSCNTRNIMGAGIAKQIKDRYPEAYEADTKAYDTEYDKDGQYVHWLGKFSKAEINDRKYIYNMYTQASIGKGREVHYEQFWQALKRVEQDLFGRIIYRHEYDGSAPPGHPDACIFEGPIDQRTCNNGSYGCQDEDCIPPSSEEVENEEYNTAADVKVSKDYRDCVCTEGADIRTVFQFRGSSLKAHA